MKNIKDTLGTLLVKEIKDLVSAIQLPSKAYCLVLAYDSDVSFPPILGIGLESERKEFLKDEDFRETLWNPAEFEYYDREELWFSDELKQLCKEFDEYIDESDYYTLRVKALNDVAKRLNEIDLDLDKTKDFVVYAVDYEQVDLEVNMRNAISENVFNRFQSNNWI